MKKTIKPEIRVGLLLVIIVLLVTLPFYMPNKYFIRVATLCAMYSALAMSLNLITGFMGQVSLGHAAFLGIGAYTSAILSDRMGWPFLVTMLCAVAVTGLFGVVIGVPSLRLKGSYLAIVTLGFCEVVRLTELNWMSLTRGPLGMTGIARPVIFGYEIRSNSDYYFLSLVLLAVIFFLLHSLVNSYIGRAVMAVREDDIAADACGINVRRYKVMVFTISSALTGMIGAFYAHYMRFIDPSAFNFEQSTSILSMVILGGLGGIPGSILGAVLLTILPEALRDMSNMRMLIYGLVIAVMMIFRPQGILGRTTFAQILGLHKSYAMPNKDAKKKYQVQTEAKEDL